MSETLKLKWTHFRNLLSRGHTEISLFYSIIQMSLIIWLAVRDSISIRRHWVFIVIPSLILFAGAIQLLVGYLMDRWKMIDHYYRWEFDRNPQIRELLDRARNEKP